MHPEHAPRHGGSRPARHRTRPRQRTAAALQIDVAWKLRKSWRAVTLLRQVARYAAAAEGFRTGRLSVAVVGARAMARIHCRFTDQPGPTDVLTFDLGCDLRAGVLDAEVVLCADLARRNAAAATLRAARGELALYVVHGLLHLAGFDDHTPSAFARMHAREDEILRRLGLGPVFRTGQE